MTSTLCLFNQKIFYETLVSSQNITDKLNSLRISCLKNDAQYIYSTINVIYDVLLSAHQIPFTKYNTLQTVLYMLQTSSTLAIELIEIYILPILTDIALHYAHKRTEKDLEDYFIERGFRNSSGIRKLGKTFVQSAIQIVFSASKIKIFQTLLYAQMEISSKFKITSDLLIKKGLKMQEFDSSFDTTVIRNKYLKNLKQFQHETLGIFLTKKLKQEIVFSHGMNQFFKKIVESDNCFITVTLINTCVLMLSDISHQFPHKKHYLNLFNFFIKQGNIYAIIIAHNSLFIRQFFEQIAKVNGQSSLSYGKMIYPDVIGTLQQKFQFYCQFLRCLQIWSCCLPKNQLGQVSELKQMFDFLKNKRNFIFPQNLMLQKIVNQYQTNISKKQRKNEHILRYIEHDKEMFSQIGNLKSNIDTTFLKEVSKSFSKSKTKNEKKEKLSNLFEKSKSNVLKQKIKDSTISLNNIQNFINKKRERGQFEGSQKQSNKSFAQLFDQVNYCLMQVKQGKKLKKNINHLKTFQQQWQNLKISYKDELSQHKIQHGNDLADKIDKIGILYQQLCQDMFTRQNFIHEVLLVLHPPEFKLMPKIKSKKSYESSNSISNQNKVLAKNMKLLSQSQYFGQPTPITHNVLEENKNNKEQNNSINKNEVSIVNRNQLSLHAQQSPNSEILSIQYTISQDLNKSKEVKQKKYLPPRRSAPFQQTNINSIQMGLSQNEKRNPNKFTNTEASTQRLIQNGKGRLRNRQTYRTFQSRASLSQNSIHQSIKNSRFSNSRKIKGFQLSKCALQKLIYTVTSKSIKAYTTSVTRSFKKRNSLTEKKQQKDMSIIRRQYLRMKSRQESQRKLYLSQSTQKHNLYYSDRQMVTSSLLTQKAKERESNLSKQTSFQLINDKFSYYFPQNKSNKNTKNFLKNKGILFESAQLEIGFVHYRKELSLDFTLYITAKVNLPSIYCSVQSDSNMQAYVDTNNISSMLKGKQEYIKVSTSLIGVPYFLPSLLIKLKKQSEKQQSLIRIILPCTFNKYVSFNSLTNQRCQSLSSQYLNGSNFRTHYFKMPKKLLNYDGISKYLSFFTAIKSSLHKSFSYQTEGFFKNESYLIQLIQQQKLGWYLTGFSLNEHSKPMQFLLHTLFFLLQE